MKFIIENTVCEEQEKYYINNDHDKFFRSILDDKLEAVKFINKTLKLQPNLEPEDIEKYTSSFVTQELKSQESDIVYKQKGKNVFFLIEHQTKVDYRMALRILQYEYEIIKSAIHNKNKATQEDKIPNVIPIVLYTGKKRWNSNIFLQQEKLTGYEELPLGKYEIVDVNDFEEEELLKEKSFLSKAMLIEKKRPADNLGEYLKRIVEEIEEDQETYTKEQKELLTVIIDVVLRKKIDNQLAEKLTKQLNKKEGKNMLAILETIEEENRMLVEKGRKEGIKETAKKMLEERIPIETIIKITGLKENVVRKMADKVKNAKQ